MHDINLPVGFVRWSQIWGSFEWYFNSPEANCRDTVQSCTLQITRVVVRSAIEAQVPDIAVFKEWGLYAGI